jgi:hypothetical protein
VTSSSNASSYSPPYEPGSDGSDYNPGAIKPDDGLNGGGKNDGTDPDDIKSDGIKSDGTDGDGIKSDGIKYDGSK